MARKPGILSEQAARRVLAAAAQIERDGRRRPGDTGTGGRDPRVRPAQILFAVCTDGWDGGGSGTVVANPCGDSQGNGVITDIELTLYTGLPAGQVPRPLLEAGDVICYVPCDFLDVSATDEPTATKLADGVMLGAMTLPSGDAGDILYHDSYSWLTLGIGTKGQSLKTDAGGALPEWADTVQLGVPTGAYTSGATITLDPCDSAGVDNGEDSVTVQAGWTLPANTEIPTSAIIPYQAAADGNYYALGQPREVITNIQYDTSTHKLQKKVRYDFGVFATTESSSWVDITTARDCTAV